MKSSVRFSIPLFLATCVSPMTAAPPRWQPWDGVTLIHEGWKYVESEENTPPADLASAAGVDLPHTWNAKDSLEQKNVRRGVS